MTLEKFKEIFDSHFDSIKNFLYYKCGDIEMAEDLAQDAFLKLWEHREKIKEDTIKSYVYTIANNLFINHIKHKKVVFDFAFKQEKKDELESPQYILENKEFKSKLESAIAGLTEKQRVVFLMNRIEGLTYNEIAIRLEISVKTVEKRMKNALEALKGSIQHKI